MARVKKDSVVNNEKIIDTAIMDDDTGDVIQYIDKYEVIPKGRCFYIRHWNGGALPTELLGAFTSVYKAKQALATYYKRRSITDEERYHFHSDEEFKQRSQQRS